MKVVDRYLLRYFVGSLILVTVAFGLLFVVINMVEELRRFIDHSIPIGQILTYYAYFSGWIIKSFLPVFVLLAALMSIGILARRNELLAMKASGISLYRISIPLLVFSFLLSIGHIYFNEVIYPDANKKRVEMKEYVIRKRSRDARLSARNIYRQISEHQFLTINSYNISKMEGINAGIYQFDDDRMIELITAKTLKFTSRNWMLYDGIQRTFSDSGEVFNRFDSLSAAYIKERPADFEIPIGKPEDMGYEELERYIEMMRRTGGSYQRELVDLKLKISFPFASFIVILICVPLASNTKRAGIAVSFSIGAGIALLYFVCFKTIQSLGYGGRLHPDLAAWLVNGIFFIIGLIIIWRTRK